MKYFYLILLIGLLLVSCGTSTTNEETAEAEIEAFAGLLEKAKPLFGTLPSIAENAENVLTDEKVALGKMLYFDVRLSKDNKISCNSCHNLSTAGVDNLPVSPGNDEGSFGGRNSPTVLNAAFHIAQFWDGRAKDVEEQAGGPILNPVEMAIPSKNFLEDRLAGIVEYKMAFASAFPEDENPIKYINVQKSIAAFERKLVTPSAFDAFLAGDNNAINDEQKAGLDNFISIGCIACHSGNLLGGNMYQKFGTFGNYWELTGSDPIDNGRFDLTQNEADKYMFKVPSLRNVAGTSPYFHDGSVKDLGESVKIMAKLQLNKELSEEEAKSIVTFLNSLSGEVPVGLKSM
jgi:cytochrome c peroxidase